MRKLVFAVSLVSFSLLVNVCASDLGNVKSEIENFVGIIAPQDNENVFVDQVVQEFKVLFDDISVELEAKLNNLTVELEKKSDSALEEKADLILEGKFLLELKDSFLNAFNPILNVENYKDHHKRELKDSIEKFNEALENISNDNFVNNIFDKDGNLAKQLPTQDVLLAKMQKLNASLYAILLEGKKLNEKRLDDILDIYYRMLLYTKNNKLKVGTITAVSALAVIGAIYLYKKKSSVDAPEAPADTDSPADTDKPGASDTAGKEGDKIVFFGKGGKITEIKTTEAGAKVLEDINKKRAEEKTAHLSEGVGKEVATKVVEAALNAQTPVTIVDKEELELRMEEEVGQEAVEAGITFDNLGLTKAPLKKLSDAGINTVDELLDTREEDLLNIKGIGQKTVNKILNVLHSIWKRENAEFDAEFNELNSNSIVDEVVEPSSDDERGLRRTETMSDIMKTVKPVPSAEVYPQGDHELRKRDLDQ